MVTVYADGAQRYLFVPRDAVTLAPAVDERPTQREASVSNPSCWSLGAVTVAPAVDERLAQKRKA